MKAKILISAIMGVIFAFCAYIAFIIFHIYDAFLYAVLFGLLTFILMLTALLIDEKVKNKRYAKIEKEIVSPVFYKTNGNFALGEGKIKNGNIYFCENGIVFASFDEKPFAVEELPAADIDRYFYDEIHLNIAAKDGRCYIITVPDAKKVMSALREKGWLE